LLPGRNVVKKLVTDTMLTPTYVSRFSCIGGDCEDTCCGWWGITLDKETFFRYQSCPDPVLRPLFKKHVKRYSHSKSSQDYGHIQLRQDDCLSCPLLNDAKLCRVHERLGEKALSDTCAYYPRTIHSFGDLHQMTLSLSCPEAARLALLNEDAFGFVGLEYTVSRHFIISIPPKGGLSLAVMEDVRSLMFQVLRSPDISLANRLRVIGQFCERLTELLQNHQVEAVPELILRLEGELESGEALAPFASFAELLDVQAQIVGSMFTAALKPSQSPHVQQVLDEVAKGLGIQDGVPLDGPALIVAYEKGMKRLAPALATVPWLLEHYLLNEALREFFPWTQENPKQDYAFLVIRFVLARLMLVGRAAAREMTLTPMELAETMYVACRRYHHDVKFTKSAHQDLVEAGWGTLDRLQALL
jgi:lysine-N-methylase